MFTHIMASDPRARMSKFISHVLSLVCTEYKMAMLVEDIDISRLMDNAEQIEDEKMMESSREFKKTELMVVATPTKGLEMVIVKGPKVGKDM